MFANNRIETIIDRVTAVDPKQKTVTTTSGQTINYHKLILGTGSRPFVPPLPGADLDGVFTMRSLADAEQIQSYMQKKNPQRLVFAGAGFISLELAALLKQVEEKDYQIDIVELMDTPLPLMLDSELGEQVKSYLQEQGLNLHMGRKVSSIQGQDGQVNAIELDSGEKLDTDMVFMNVGAKPNVELARDMGLDMGTYGIRVNEFLETSDPDVLAAGDCADNFHFLTKKPVPIQLRGPAVIQGRLLAKRLAGYDIPFPGLLGNSAVKLFDKYIAATGFSEYQAGTEGFDPVCATVESSSKHGMIPGVKPWLIKLVFDKKSERLIGGQIVSDSESAVKEIDTVNALIVGQRKVSDLVTLMCAGNPDCSSEPSKEPISIAAEQALQKM